MTVSVMETAYVAQRKIGSETFRWVEANSWGTFVIA
jgi:hypothetical protein